MRISRGIAAASIALALIVTNGAVQAQEKAVPSSHAACLVRISSPRTVFPLNEDVVSRLIRSSPVVKEPIRTILGKDGAAIDDVAVLSFALLDQSQTQDMTVLMGELSVELKGDLEPRADEFLAAICRRTRNALQAVGESETGRLRVQSTEIGKTLEETELEYRRLLDVQRELYQQAGRDDLERGPIVASIRSLEERSEDLRLRLAGMQARQQAITEQIAKIAKDAETDPESQAIIEGLRRIVELRQQALDHVRNQAEAGRVSAEEVNKAEIEVIQARSDLARQQEQLRFQKGGGMLADMNKQLIELSIDYESTMAELGICGSRLAGMRDKRLIELAERYTNEVELPKRLIERMLTDLKEQQYRLTQQLRQVSVPEMQVVGE